MKLLSLFLILLAPSGISQTTWNVPGDSNTIQGAINLAATGDTILVASGTYPENLDLQSKGLVISSTDGPELTTINGSGNDTLVLLNNTPVGTLVEGFTLTGGKGHPANSSYGYDYYGGAVHASNGAVAEISNCYLLRNQLSTGTFAGGAYSGGQDTHLTLSHCVIAFNHAWASGGATLTDWYGKISMRRCTVFGNTSNNFFGHQGGVAGANYGDTWIDDCIIWGNEGDDIGAFGSPYNVGVDFYVNYSDVDGGWTGTGNINSNPLFVDSTADDFNLQSGSPCIDAGNPVSTPDPDGSRADMGAFAFQGGPTGPALQVINLVAGSTSTATASGFDPSALQHNASLYFCFSLSGTGTTNLWSGVNLDILNPILAGHQNMDANGTGSLGFQIGPNQTGQQVWVQAVGYDLGSIPPYPNYQITPVWTGVIQ